MSSATSNPPVKPVVLAQRYRLDRRLAQGGMAEVWLGFDQLLSRPVAVKVLKASLAEDPVVAERFRREAVAVAQLSHPNVVAVYDAISERGRQAVVMQLVNGKSLRQLLDEQKKLSPDLTIHIGTCVASALDAAHRAGLVHRDVKPGNILITPDGRVLLTDFGIAKGLESADDDLTNENIMMGTAKYLSPEQVRGRRLDGRADLYALGLVLYECLAGRVPFLGGSDVETALARLQRAPTDITTLRPTLPFGLAPLIHRLLARRPEDRYGSGAELRAALAEVAARAKEPLDLTGGDRSDDQLRRDRTPVGPGYTSVRTTGRAVGVPVRPDRERTPTGPVRPPRDRTPTTGTRPEPLPNRRNEQGTRRSLIVVAALIAVAALLAAVLWKTIGGGDPSTTAGLPSTTVVAADPASGPGAATVPTGQPTAAAAVGPVAAVAFDPDGDGEENDAQATNVVDGNPSTAWSTVCYSGQYLGGKVGVGVAVTVSAPSAGTLEVDLANGPWNVDIFASSAPTPPATIDGWGSRIASDSGAVAGTMRVPITTGAAHFLVLLHEVGRSDQCSGDHPYRGTITEVRFQAAS